LRVNRYEQTGIGGTIQIGTHNKGPWKFLTQKDHWLNCQQRSSGSKQVMGSGRGLAGATSTKLTHLDLRREHCSVGGINVQVDGTVISAYRMHLLQQLRHLLAHPIEYLLGVFFFGWVRFLYDIVLAGGRDGSLIGSRILSWHLPIHWKSPASAPAHSCCPCCVSACRFFAIQTSVAISLLALCPRNPYRP